MDEGDADSSANVIDLNSPKVIEKASHSGDNGKFFIPLLNYSIALSGYLLLHWKY